MKIDHIRICAFSVLAMGALTAQAQEKRDMFNPEKTEVTSQTIAPDARAGGMGDTGAATDPDVNSQYWNPAKYPFTISRAGVALNYTPWLRQLVNDIDLAYLAGYYRIGDYSAVSASLRYFSLGEVQAASSQSGNYDLTVNPYEMSVDVAYSLMLSETFSIAAAIEMDILRSEIRLHRRFETGVCASLPISQPTIRTTSTSEVANASWDSV